MVLKRLFKPKNAVSRPAVPDGVRVYAIGDVHGRRDLLDLLIAQIDRDAAGCGKDVQIVQLGDLVDRGPDSAGAVARARDLRDSHGARFLLGNHEEVFLKAMARERDCLRLFTRIGGRETLISYGITRGQYDSTGYDELHTLMLRHVPKADLDFLASFEDMIRIGDYLFVHAGIRPGVPLDQQTPNDLRWIRAAFLDHGGSHGPVVVHGHSITDMVDERSNRIGIDTGAFASGRLTALVLDGTERRYLVTDPAQAASVSESIE